MSPLRLIMGAGLCSLALSGCIPAVAGLALQAAGIVTGGGGTEGKGFRNPRDTYTSERAVREALSQIDDRVDPACQAILDARRSDGQTAATGPAEAKPEGAPINLLSKVTPEPGQPDVARAAETAPGAAQVAEKDAEKGAAKGDGGATPVKVALAPSETDAPGQCKHRLVCLPGTPKPTLMLMCPGKRGAEPDTKATVAAETPKQATTEATAAAETADHPSHPAEAARAPASAPEPASTPLPAPARTIEGGGVADWNWSYDPSKQL